MYIDIVHEYDCSYSRQRHTTRFGEKEKQLLTEQYVKEYQHTCHNVQSKT